MTTYTITGNWTIVEVQEIAISQSCTPHTGPFNLSDNFNLDLGGTINGRVSSPGPGTWGTPQGGSNGVVHDGTLTGPVGNVQWSQTCNADSWVQVGFVLNAVPSTDTGTGIVISVDQYYGTLSAIKAQSKVTYPISESAQFFLLLGGSTPFGLDGNVGKEVSFRWPIYNQNNATPPSLFNSILRAEVCSTQVAGTASNADSLAVVSNSTNKTISFTMDAGYSISNLWVRWG